MDLIERLLINILDSLYQIAIFSLIMAALFMFAYMLIREQGWRSALRKWIDNYKREKKFRNVFYFAFYTAMIMFRTLFNRGMWIHPLSNVIGVWGIFDASGKITTENVENLMLFLPFTFLYLLVFGEKLIKERFTFIKVIWRTAITTFLMSFAIEFLQLFLRVGTFQLSDLFYNTFGGLIGGVIYFIFLKCCERNTKKQEEKDVV